MKFTLSTPNTINGGQLAQEINAATGLQLSIQDVGFEPPITIELMQNYPEHHDTISSVVAAHNPAD